MTANGRHVDYVVIGLGALGSATAMELARSGHRVVGLERFGLGHSWGASHDTSRILRHSYHTPDYVRLTQEAYADWARLERDAGTSLVSVVGGLDLFPPEPAISPVDYTESLDEVGIDYELLDAAAVMRRWPQFRLPDGLVALHQADAAIVPAARGTRVMQDQARLHGADLRELTPVLDVRDLGVGGVEVETAAGRAALRRARGVRGRVGQRRARRASGTRIPLEVTLEQVTYFEPPRPGDSSPRAGCRCGSGWTTRRTTASRRTASRPSRPPRTAGARSSTRTGAARRPTRACRRASPSTCARMLPGQRGAGAFAALPVHADPRPRLRDLAGARARVGRRRDGRGPRRSSSRRRSAGCSPTSWSRGRTTTDLTPFRMDRPALTDPDYQAHWLV